MSNSKDDPGKKLDDVLSRFLSEPPEATDADAEDKAETSADKNTEGKEQKH